MHPLIIGIDGLIGKALWSFFKEHSIQVVGTCRQKNRTDALYFDLEHSDPESLCPLADSITHVLIPAAIPNIAECERNPDKTSLCNVTKTVQLAQYCWARGIKTVLFSTDYVFDGISGNYSEADLPNPLNEYGRQKAELEKQALACPPEMSLILRLTKVYNVEKPGVGLLEEMKLKLRQGETIRAAKDQIFSPVYLEDVIQGIYTLMLRQAHGVYHLGGPESWSRYDLACSIAKSIQAPLSLVEPISLSNLGEKFKRPLKTDLCCDKFHQATGLTFKKTSDLISQLNCDGL